MLSHKIPNEIEVRATVRYAKGIAFDGCHKIYVLMDDEQVNAMRRYGYGEGDGSYLITAQPTDGWDTVIQRWWDDSCGLRFIEATSTKADGTVEFNTLVGQGEDED